MFRASLRSHRKSINTGAVLNLLQDDTKHQYNKKEEAIWELPLLACLDLCSSHCSGLSFCRSSEPCCAMYLLQKFILVSIQRPWPPLANSKHGWCVVPEDRVAHRTQVTESSCQKIQFIIIAWGLVSLLYQMSEILFYFSLFLALASVFLQKRNSHERSINIMWRLPLIVPVHINPDTCKHCWAGVFMPYHFCLQIHPLKESYVKIVGLSVAASVLQNWTSG